MYACTLPRHDRQELAIIVLVGGLAIDIMGEDHEEKCYRLPPPVVCIAVSNMQTLIIHDFLVFYSL